MKALKTIVLLTCLFSLPGCCGCCPGRRWRAEPEADTVQNLAPETVIPQKASNPD